MAGAIQTPLTDLYGTPRPLFESLEAEFDFTVDGAASHEMPVIIEREKGRPEKVLFPSNNKLPHWYGPGGECENAIAADWGHERVFLNYPFSLADVFLAKSYEAALAGALVVVLMKVRTSPRSWRRCVMAGADEVRLVEGRLTYQQPWRLVSATFDSCVVVFRPGLPGGAPPEFSVIDRLGRTLDLAREQRQARLMA